MEIGNMRQNEVVKQCFMNGPTWDGDLISKVDRTEGCAAGMLYSEGGWTILTKTGLRACLLMKYDQEKEKRDRQRRAS